MLASVLALCRCGRHDVLEDKNEKRIANPNLNEKKSKGGPSSVTEKESEPSEAWRTAKAGLSSTLEFAEMAADGIPIPGVKLVFSGIISLINRIDTVNANTEALERLRRHVDLLTTDASLPLKGLKEEDIPLALKNNLIKLADDLQKAMKPWEARAKRNPASKFITSDDDSGDLASLAEDIRLSVERFTVSGDVQGLMSDARQEQALSSIQQHQLEQKVAEDKKEINRVVNNLRHAEAASFDYGGTERREIVPCLEGTRTEVLTRIKNWVESSDADQQRIFWLNGMAGLGKSTISRSIAEWAKGKGLLGANFFFSRDVQTLRDPTLLFPTLAYQLSRFNTEFKTKLASILSEDPDIHSRDSASQFDQLIQQPWAACQAQNTKTCLIVIDAVDECAIEAKVKELLRILLIRSRSMPGRFLVFMTSRPEGHIQAALRVDGRQGLDTVLLHDVEKSVVERDIDTYIHYGLSHISDVLDDFSPPKGWPKDEDISLIVKQSGQLFIYAATALRFISNEQIRDPVTQLGIISDGQVGGASTHSDRPFSTLDELYLRVLQSAVSDDEGNEHWHVKRIREVVATIVLLRNPLPMSVFAELLNLKEQEARSSLYHLQSIISVPAGDTEGDGSSPRYYHPSFPDFFKDPERCKDERFRMNVMDEETRICLRCFEVMANSLKRNMLDVEDRVKVDDLKRRDPDRFTRAFPPLLRYACSYWVSHLMVLRGDYFTRDIETKLKDFAEKHLLEWIEAMSWLGIVNVAIASLQDISFWLNSQPEDDLLSDASRFLIYNQNLISEDPMEVYRSALAFSPRDSLVYQTFEKKCLVDTVRVLRGVPNSWPPFRFTLTHRWVVCCAAFSQDRQWIATGSDCTQLHLWDAYSGVKMFSSFLSPDLDGWVSSIAFSVDAATVAAALSNSKIHDIFVVDSLSGATERTLKGHDDAVNDLDIIQKDGCSLLASASSDSYIRLWNISSGECTLAIRVMPVDTPSPSPPLVVVSSVKFVSGGNQLLSCSQDSTIRLWDRKTGQQIRYYSHSSNARLLAISSDGIKAVFADSECASYVVSCGLDAGGPVALFRQHEDPIRSAIFTEDDLEVLVQDYTTLRLFQHGDDNPRQLPNNVPSPVGSLQVGVLGPTWDDNIQVAVVPETDVLNLRVWDYVPTNIRGDANESLDHKCKIGSLAFSPDGSILASGGSPDDNIVQIWDALDGRHLKTINRLPSGPVLLAFSPDSSKLACATSGVEGCFVVVWEAGTWKEVIVLGPHKVDYWAEQAKLDFGAEGTAVYIATPFRTLEWRISDGVFQQRRLKDNATEQKKPIELEREKREVVVNEFAPTGLSGHYELSVCFRINGKESHVVIPMTDASGSGCYAYCRSRVATPCNDGRFLLLDVSKILNGVELQNSSFMFMQPVDVPPTPPDDYDDGIDE